MNRVQDLFDEKCPNIQRAVEICEYLNVCPDEGRTRLFHENIELLDKWLHQGNRTHPELACWIPKYLLLQGRKKFSDMGPMSPTLR